MHLARRAEVYSTAGSGASGYMTDESVTAGTNTWGVLISGLVLGVLVGGAGGAGLALVLISRQTFRGDAAAGVGLFEFLAGVVCGGLTGGFAGLVLATGRARSKARRHSLPIVGADAERTERDVTGIGVEENAAVPQVDHPVPFDDRRRFGTSFFSVLGGGVMGGALVGGLALIWVAFGTGRVWYLSGACELPRCVADLPWPDMCFSPITLLGGVFGFLVGGLAAGATSAGTPAA